MSSEVIITCDRCNGKIRSDEHYCADCLSSVESDRDKYKADFDILDSREETLGIEVSDLKDKIADREKEIERLTGELYEIKNLLTGNVSETYQLKGEKKNAD